MMFAFIYIFLLTLHVGRLERNGTSKNERHKVRTFPERFIFGTSTASYQVEGAWNEDGKSENIWDCDTHQIPSPIKDQSTGDIAADSYHKYKRDVELVRELGLDFYRFSLSWSRILPSGFSDQINQPGVDYYNNLINELQKYNIKPLVTLFHWDLPQTLQDLGGWSNPYIVDWFGDYARTVFNLFGDRVKLFITVNEPIQTCAHGYGLGMYAPRLNSHGIGEYLCSKYFLLAHARAYHIYDEGFRATQGGSIMITMSARWMMPDSESDIELAKVYNQFDTGMYAHPIFSQAGDWPDIVKERIANKSKEQGFPRSRLPDFTKEEIEYLRGTSDYFGLNHYSSYYVKRNTSAINRFKVPSRDDDIGAYFFSRHEWAIRETDIINYVPWAFYELLMHIKNTYGNPPIFITENGFGTRDSGLDDDNRVTYYRGYLGAMLDAIDDGADIRGYTAWCLMDAFEWSWGYTARYGLYHVNYTDPERTRTPRQSAFVYKEIVRTRTLDPHYEPDTNVMTIAEGH